MPCGAAIGGFEESAASAVELVAVLPRALANFPHGGVDDIGIRRIDLDVGAAGVFVLRNNFLPVLAAIGRTVKAALFAGTVRVAEDGGENPVWIARIDGERGDLLAVAKAEMGPGLARVGGFVDAVADGEIGAMQSFAAGDINDVGIGGSDRDGADGLRGFVIEDGIPGAAVIVRFPDAAVHLPDVKHSSAGWARRRRRGCGRHETGRSCANATPGKYFREPGPASRWRTKRRPNTQTEKRPACDRFTLSPSGSKRKTR